MLKNAIEATLIDPLLPSPNYAFESEYIDHRKFGNNAVKSWTNALPANVFTTMNDPEFVYAIRSMCQYAEKVPFACENMPDLPQKDGKETFAHLRSCSKCSAAVWSVRHDAIVNVLKKVLSFHSILARIPAKNEYPLVGNRKGGPDLIVYAASVDAVDVTVTNEALEYETSSRNRAAFTRKIRKYRQSEGRYAFRTVPFVINTRGAVSSSTLELISESWFEYAPNPSKLRAQVVQYAAFAMFKACYQADMLLRNRRTPDQLEQR
jgi:hypothetical protein